MTQQWIYGITNIEDARHITSIVQSHLITHKKIQIIIQVCLTEVCIFVSYVSVYRCMWKEMGEGEGDVTTVKSTSTFNI